MHMLMALLHILISQYSFQHSSEQINVFPESNACTGLHKAMGKSVLKNEFYKRVLFVKPFLVNDVCECMASSEKPIIFE